MAAHQSAPRSGLHALQGRPVQHHRITAALVNTHKLAVVIDGAARARALEAAMSLQKMTLRGTGFWDAVSSYLGAPTDFTIVQTDRKIYNQQVALQKDLLNRGAIRAIKAGPATYKAFLTRTAQHLTEQQLSQRKFAQAASANAAGDEARRKLMRAAAYTEFAAGVAFKSWQLVVAFIPGPAGSALSAEGFAGDVLQAVAGGDSFPQALVHEMAHTAKESFAEKLDEKMVTKFAKSLDPSRLESLYSTRSWLEDAIEATKAQARLPEGKPILAALKNNIGLYTSELAKVEKGIASAEHLVAMGGIIGGKAVQIISFANDVRDLWQHLDDQLAETQAH